MPLIADPTLATVRTLGVMGAGSLRVPATVAALAARYSLREAEDLVAWVGAFPEAAAVELGWSIEEVQTSARQLADTLETPASSEPLSFGVPAPEGVEFGRTTAAELARRRRS